MHSNKIAISLFISCCRWASLHDWLPIRYRYTEGIRIQMFDDVTYETTGLVLIRNWNSCIQMLSSSPKPCQSKHIARLVYLCALR